MATTVKDVCQDALREIGILDAVEAGTDADVDAAFDRLNRLIDQWASERLMIYTRTRTTWTIVASQASYTVGSGANVDIARPGIDEVTQIHYVDTSQDPDLELELNLLSEDAWSKVPQRALTSQYPTSAYYNPTFPNGTLHFWPIPTNSSLEGVIYHWTAVSEYTALTDSVALPGGYRRMMITNLAMELCPLFGVQPNPVLVKNSMESMGTVKRSNKRIADLQFDPGALVQGRDSLNYYNISSGP